MLQSIHNATKNWIGYAVLVLLTIVLVGAFALWGVGDIFRGGVDTTVANVGDRTIERSEFDRELRNQIRAYSASRNIPEMSVEEARAMGLDKEVLERMIDRVAIDERVAALGLTATDEAIRRQIQRDQNFEGGNGQFDKGRFLQLLQKAQITESEYVESVRGDVSRQQYLVAAVAGVNAPPRLARLVFDYVSEQRVAQYLVVRPDDAGAVNEPSESELVAYHKAHANLFSTPEYREIEYIKVGVDEVGGNIQVSEDELKKSWEARKQEYQKPEKREIEQIAFPDQASAQAAYARIQAGTPFLTVAHDAGKSDADLKLGTYDRAGLDARLAAAAFALPEGGVSPPVQGPFTWAILRVARITPDQSKTFEQVRDELRLGLIKERASERIRAIADKFEDERGGDQPLARAARTAGITAHRATIDSKGLMPDGTKAQIPAAPVFLQQAFATEADNESEIFTDPDGAVYAVRVVNVRPPALRPLDGVRTQVRERLLAERRGKQLLTRVQSLAATAQRDGNLDGAARALARAPQTSAALTRGSAGDVFSSEALSKVFASPPGAAVYGRVGKGNGYVLARVTRVTHPQPAPESIAALRGEVSQQVARDVGETVAKAARADAGVEIHQQVLQAAGEVR